MTVNALPGLLSEPDGFEVVRDRIAELLAANAANQVALAGIAGDDPALYALDVFVERTNPWESYLNAQPHGPVPPVVNVWYESGTFDGSKGGTVAGQPQSGTFNVDVYGFGVSVGEYAGQLPGDEGAAFNAQRGIRLCRQILMAAQNTYLQFDPPNRLVWSRWVNSITSFQPEIEDPAAISVLGMRLSFAVTFNEETPQFVGEDLEEVAVDIFRTSDGKLVAQAEYDLTGS